MNAVLKFKLYEVSQPDSSFVSYLANYLGKCIIETHNQSIRLPHNGDRQDISVAKLSTKEYIQYTQKYPKQNAVVIVVISGISLKETTNNLSIQGIYGFISDYLKPAQMKMEINYQYDY